MKKQENKGSGMSLYSVACQEGAEILMDKGSSYKRSIIKLSHFSNRLRAIYKQNGFSSIPFNREEMATLINACQNDLEPLFKGCFGENTGLHLLNKFYTFRGDIFEFYGSLDDENSELFSQFNW